MIALRTLIMLLALTALGCAAATYRLDAPKTISGVELAPYAIHEECVELRAGERIDYFFTAKAPVNFNIHFHDANAVVMPISSEHTMRESGDFTADRQHIYCLMWEAGAQGSVLDYRVRPLPRQ